jgi:DNA repair exonuclease SbcCD ATPase subunit
VIERSAHAKLEKENQSLAERVTTLTRELASAKSLEAALAAEKAERLELETQLKLAEQRLQAARTPPPPAAPTNHVPSISSTNTAPTADPGALIQVKMLEGEVGRLRETLKDSRDRETELKSLLAEAETQRLKLDAEKTQLMARLKETEKSAAAAIAASPSVRAEKTITTLELRVRELEKQRELLERKLASAANRSLVQIASERRLRGLTPRERAAETHLGR